MAKCTRPNQILFSSPMTRKESSKARCSAWHIEYGCVPAQSSNWGDTLSKWTTPNRKNSPLLLTDLLPTSTTYAAASTVWDISTMAIFKYRRLYMSLWQRTCCRLFWSIMRATSESEFSQNGNEKGREGKSAIHKVNGRIAMLAVLQFLCLPISNFLDINNKSEPVSNWI